MKHIEWSLEKNEKLRARRNVSFEDVEMALGQGYLLDIVPHWDLKRYPTQRVFIVTIQGYAYLVPFVEDDEKIFLKTIIPSRKATKKYITSHIS